MDMKEFTVKILRAEQPFYSSHDERAYTLEENKRLSYYKINPFKTKEGKHLTTLTEHGILFAQDQLNQQSSTPSKETQVMSNATLEAPIQSVPSFEIESNIPMSNARVTQSKYPFEHMEVGQSFHIATDKKSILATVNQHNRRYATPSPDGATRLQKTKKYPEGRQVAVLVYSRKFACRRVDSTDPRGAGYRVFRTV